MAAKRPPRLTRAESKEQTRAALLNSAHQVFLKLGYSRATLDLVAADAGYTKGAIYWNWDSKEGLFLELLQSILSRNVEQLEVLVARGQESPKAMMEAVGLWVDGVDTGDDALLLLEIELEARRNPALAPRFEQLITEHEAKIADVQTLMFAAMGRDPIIPVERLAQSVIILAEGFALARQTRKGCGYRASDAIRALSNLPPRED
jgi:AcrR family transcriptional regulator